MIKKIILSVSVIVAFIFYAVYQKSGGLEIRKIGESTPLTSPQETPSVPKHVNGLKDGFYTEDVADALYGNVQVKAVVSGGKITDVEFLQYPSDRQTSIEINSQAMPILKQEAIQTQSAQVDTVSGASATSAAFKESLKSALDQAKS